MSANGFVMQVSGVDRKSEVLVPFFGPTGGGFTDPFWYARMVEDGGGSIPGIAEVVLGNDQGLSDSPSNTAWNPDTVWFQNIQQNTDIRIWRNYDAVDQDGSSIRNNELVFTGKVDDIQQDRDVGLDQVIVRASDCRTELRKVRVAGRVICYNGGTLGYQDGWPPHFNPGGRANCTIDKNGNPWFSPYPDYGLDPFANSSQAQNPQSASQAALLGAQGLPNCCYWTLALILLYLKNVYGPDATIRSSLADFQFFPFNSVCPSWLVWPDTFGAGLDYEGQANFDQGIGQNNAVLGSARKGRDINLNGFYLSGEPGKEGAFDMLFSACGGSTWTVQPGVDQNLNVTNTLVSIPNIFDSAAQAVDIPFAAGGAASSTLKIGTVTRGTIRENSKNTISRVVGRGALVKVEQRVNTVGDLYTSGGGLLAAWQQSRFTAFMNLVITLGGDEIAFQAATSFYPEVLTTVQLDDGPNAPNFAFGTPYQNYPFATISRPIWPYLLSFQGGTTGARDSITKPYPIRVEVDTTGGGNWVVATEFAVQEVLDNGQIFLPALRDIPIAQDNKKYGIWRFAAGKSFPIQSVNDIVLNNIRFTCAIPLDHRLTYAVRPSWDQTNLSQSSFGYFDINNECPDSDKFAPGFSRTSFLELHTLYEQWIQNSSFPSFPIPASAGGTAQTNLNLRNDQPFLQSHVRRHLRDNFRLSRDGSILKMDGCFCTSYPVGTLVGNLKPAGSPTQTPYSSKSVVYRRRFITERTSYKGMPSFANRTEHLLA